jgi:uncharacterized LabA/DUF88 family protein
MADGVPSTHRVRVFVDFWNLQLALNTLTGSQFQIDWKMFPQWLATDAVKMALTGSDVQPEYEGAHVYISYNPRNPGDAKLKHWATSFLDRLPGVQVVLKERVPRFPPKCQACYQAIEVCPHCGAKIAGTVEKGVDNAIATDLIKLAWEQAYDWAVLVSSDTDFIPVAEFLQGKGKKIIHGAFPPIGSDLSCKCWASIGLGAQRQKFERKTA